MSKFLLKRIWGNNLGQKAMGRPWERPSLVVGYPDWIELLHQGLLTATLLFSDELPVGLKFLKFHYLIP